MNGFFLARRYMFRQKRRTLLTAFGIALAIALVCGVGVLFDSFRMLLINEEIQSSGNWHYDISNISSADDARVLAANRAFEAGSVYSSDLYARFEADYGSDKYSDNYAYLQIFQGDSDYVAMSSLPYRLKAGRLPESADEIVISVNARAYFRDTPSLGDAITLPVGALEYERREVEDLYALHIAETRTYTVVGFCDNSTRLSRSFFAFTLPDGGAHSYTARVRIAGAADYAAAVERAIEQSGLNADELEIADNLSLIRFNAQGLSGSTQKALLMTCGLLVAIILVMMMLVVRNTFAISIDEKMQQFGILRCLGASRKSIRSIVRAEALMMWLLAAPVGVAGALAAMQILFAVIHSLDSDMLKLLTLHWSLWPFALALSVSLVCVLLASASPARKCARVSPIGAVRGEGTLRARVRRARGGRLLGHALGFPGLMSARNMRRNPRKYRATLTSVACSIALFMVMSGFASGFRESMYMYVGMDGTDVRISTDTAMEPEDLRAVEAALARVDSLDSVTGYFSEGLIVDLEGKISDELIKFYNGSGYSMNTQGEVSVKYLDRQGFEQLTFEGDAPTYEEFCQPGAVVMLQKLILGSSRDGVRVIQATTYAPGDTVECRAYAGDRDEPVQLRMIGELKAAPWYLNSFTGQIIMFAAQQNMPAARPLTRLYSLKAKSGCGDELSAAMSAMEYEPELLDWAVNDIYSMVKENRALMQVIDIFLYGFTAVIVLICAMNLLNTIKTNMNSRRREMSMLRAIGMSRRQMMQMLLLECVWYAVLGTLLGLVIGIPLELMLIVSVSSGMLTVDFSVMLLVMQSALCMVVTCAIALAAGSGPIRTIVRAPATEGIRAIE